MAGAYERLGRAFPSGEAGMPHLLHTKKPRFTEIQNAKRTCESAETPVSASPAVLLLSPGFPD